MIKIYVVQNLKNLDIVEVFGNLQEAKNWTFVDSAKRGYDITSYSIHDRKLKITSF